MTAPQISTLPTPPSRADSPATFTQRADALLGALPTFVTQANAQATHTDERATLADQKATEAANSAAAAANSETAAAASQQDATQSRNSAAISAAYAGTQAGLAAAQAAAVNQALQDVGIPSVYAGTHADAKRLVVGLSADTLIIIGADERYSGRRTLNRANAAGGESLVLDFAAGVYQVEDLVEFVGYVPMQLVEVPATSAAPGFVGAFAVDASYFYVATGVNTWKRIALGAF